MSTARDELVRRFDKYADSAYRHLAGMRPRKRLEARLTPIERGRLIEAVRWLESQPPFRELVEATRDTFQSKEHHSSGSVAWWAHAVRHFFRRSGFYLDCYERRTVDYGRLLQKYEKAFRSPEVDVTYLLPLEWVWFVERRGGSLYPREKPIDFGGFILKRYSSDELERLSGNRVNEVFYPCAVWDTQKLAWYWYLTVTGTKPVGGIGQILSDFTGLDHVQRKAAPDWLAPFQVFLYRLILYDWLPPGFGLHWELPQQAPEELKGFCWPATGIRFSLDRLIQNERHLDWEPWRGFRLPFSLACDADLIHPPPAAPHTSVLELEPYEGPGGEEIEMPAHWLQFELDQEATIELNQILLEKASTIDTPLLEAEEWEFFKIALECLLKGFLTDPYQAPAEQILWHVTALEALLGRKEDMETKEGLVKSIARRLGRLLGSNSHERERVGRHFRMVYQVRSDLVHGNRWKDYSTLCLYLARNLARQACLRYAELAATCTREGRRLPRREQIISALDSEEFQGVLGAGS